MKRPSRSDDAVLQAALLPFAKEFSVDPEGDPRAWGKLKEIMKQVTFQSNFETGKELELAGWFVDDNLLDLIENVEGKIYRAFREAQKAWVEANAIAPKLKVGAPVQVKRRLQVYEGIIASIQEQEATYTVRIPSEGHVEAGMGTHGWVIPFEELHELATPPESFELRSPASAA